MPGEARDQGQLAVSVIIPTYNRRETLARCLAALARQTYPATAYEIVVIDDGSQDGTRDFLRHFHPPCAFSSLFLPHRGPGAARNAGVRAARGDLLIFIDSDLLVVPEFIAAHVEAHKRLQGKPPGPGRHIVHGPVIHTRNLEQPFAARKKITDYSRAFFATGNVSLFREQLLAAGLFDEDFQEYGWEDLELGVRLARQGLRAAHCPAAVGYHYKEEVSLTRLPALSQRERERGHTALLFYRKQPILAVKVMTMLAWPFFLLDRLLFLGNWPAWQLTQDFLAFLERKNWRFLLVPLLHLIPIHAYFEGMREALREEKRKELPGREK